MKNYKNPLLLLFFLLAVPVGGFSCEYRLSEVIIEGNTRTRYRTVLEITGLETGIRVDDEIVEAVRQKLLESGIFQTDIDVSLVPTSDDEAVMTIRLEERWTLFPIPAGFWSSDSWMAGAFVIDSNFAGLYQLMMIGAFASNDSLFGAAVWRDPSFLGSEYSMGLVLTMSDSTKEHLSLSGEDVLASVEQNSISGLIQAGRTYVSGFGWSGGTGVVQNRSTAGTGYLTGESAESVSWQNRIDLHWDNQQQVDFFRTGISIRCTGSVYTAFSDFKSEPVVSGEISWNSLLFDRHLIYGNLTAGWQDRNNLTPVFIGGFEGSRALPTMGVAVRQYAAGTAAFEPVLFTFDWGIFTLPLYYEAGILQPVHETPSRLWHGPGVGFRFYIDKIAVPAMGADFTWNLEEGSFRASVSMGSSGGM